MLLHLAEEMAQDILYLHEELLQKEAQGKQTLEAEAEAVEA